MSSKWLQHLKKIPVLIAKGLIYLYQYTISPLLGKCCRFYPSCSDYALDAINALGFWKGFWKIILRIGKCGPWHPGGYDPIQLPRKKTH